MANPKAPPGGFKVGGWYEGKQWNGQSFGDPGVINNPSQQGYGKTVSNEVISATNPNNVAFIQQQRQEAGLATPQPGGGVPMPTLDGSGGTGGGIPALPPQPTLDLPKLYESLYSKSGITDIEKQLSDQTKQFTEAKAKINDNPFLSEGSRVGRQAKIEQLFNERTANLRNDVAVKKADIETKIALQTKQFDINSQVAKDALDKFNSLLGMGALDNASGEDLANITRSTGISSNMIQSAIKARTTKEAETQVITSTDDNGEVTVSVIDKNTGEVINQNSLGAIGNAEKVSGGGSGALKKNDYIELLKDDAKGGISLSKLFNIYSGYLSPDEILRLYNSSSSHGPDRGDIKNLAKYGVSQPKATSRQP